MRKLILIPCLFFCCWLLTTTGIAQSLTDEKAFVSALQNNLRLQYEKYSNREAPICALRFYVEFTDNYSLESSMGSLFHKQHDLSRTLVIDMHVGISQTGNVIQSTSAEKTIRLPLDPNAQSIEHILNEEIQALYSETEQKFYEQQYRKTIGLSNLLSTIPDYPNQTELVTENCIEFSSAEWEQNLCSYTNLWNSFDDHAYGKASLNYTCLHYYDIRENGFLRSGIKNTTLLSLSASITDQEGYEIPLENHYLVQHPSDLPDINSIIHAETEMHDKLQSMANTPRVSVFSGPVLFSNKAAALVLMGNYYSDNKHLLANPLLEIRKDEALVAINTTSSCSDNELVQRLQQTLKDRKIEFGYWIVFLHYAENEGFIAQEAYRIYADGRPKEQIHGLVINQNQSFWNQVMACGNTLNESIAVSALTGEAPIHCIAPAILCYYIESKPLIKKSQPHLLTPITSGDLASDQSFSALATQVIQEEVQQFFNDTNLLSAPKPYEVEYLITDALSCTIESSEGSTLHVTETPIRNINTRLMVGNNTMNNENLAFAPRDISEPLPFDNHHDNLQDVVHRCTEKAYLQALLDYETKSKLSEKKTSDGKRILPDRSDAVCVSFFDERPIEEVPTTQLENLAQNLSARFVQNDNAEILHRSGVNLYVYQANAHIINSQNVQHVRPFRLLGIQMYASVVTEDGDTLCDNTQCLFRDIHDISDMEALYNKIDRIVSKLREWKTAPKFSEFYDGPVLFSQEAISALLPYTLVENSPSLLGLRTPADPQQEEHNLWKNSLDKQVVSNTINVSARYDKESHQDITFIGYHTVDAEGISVDKKTELIHNGVLVNLLSNRTPFGHGRYSNGHQQIALCNGHLVTSLGPGILEITGKSTLDKELMMKELLKLARSQGHRYAYWVDKLGVRTDDYGQPHLHLLYVYRVSLAKGEKTMVRVSQSEPIDFNLLNRIVSVSKEEFSFNTLLKQININQIDKNNPFWGIPASFLCPSQMLINKFRIFPYE